MITIFTGSLPITIILSDTTDIEPNQAQPRDSDLTPSSPDYNCPLHLVVGDAQVAKIGGFRPLDQLA